MYIYILVPIASGGGLLSEAVGTIDPMISSYELANWGLMSSGSATGSVSFINPRQLNLIRLISKSPGKN